MILSDCNIWIKLEIDTLNGSSVDQVNYFGQDLILTFKY